MKILRFFWLALFVFFVGLASYLAEELFFPLRPSVPQGSLEWTVHQDFKKLKEESQLPPEFENVHQVFIADRRQEKTPINWPEVSKFHFKQKPDGLYDLHIEILETTDNQKNTKNKSDRKRTASEDEDADGLILQFSLFEVQSKNKIWELSRTYQNF